jgi:hypothetical protein
VAAKACQSRNSWDQLDLCPNRQQKLDRGWSLLVLFEAVDEVTIEAAGMYLAGLASVARLSATEVGV